MADNTKVGIKVDFTPTKSLFVPPITRKLIKKHREMFRRLEKKEYELSIDAFDEQCDVILECLQLNYPEITEEEFDDMINSENQPLAWLAINSDFAGVDRAKKALEVLRSGTSTGTPTPPTSPI